MEAAVPDLEGVDPEPVAHSVDVTLLPKPLAVLRFTAPDSPDGKECVFYILGTAHVSRESCDAAALLVQRIRPDLVMLELCGERGPILSMEKLPDHSLAEVLTEIRSGRSSTFQGIYSWLLARVGRDLDVMPGEEFRAALREARVVGAQVVLGDRPLSITLARVWGALSSWERARLLCSLLWAGLTMMDTEGMRREIERMKETDVLTEAIKEFGKSFPSLLVPLLTERDLFMVYIMRRLAARARTVVAVVGAGHLSGIRENWEAAIDVEAICVVPPKRRPWRWGRIALLTGGVAVAAVCIVRWRRL